MTFLDLMPILFPATFVAFLVLERLRPARAQQRVPWWLMKGIAFFVGGMALNALLPALILVAIGDRSLLHLQSLGTFGGALLVILLGDLLGYWIHRGLHSSEPVWRWTHQLHHSAERMDMAGAAFFHPLDSVAQGVIPSVAIVALLGVTPMAAAVGGFAGFVLGVAPHMNVRTPAWLGYVFQRPEMHAVHHERGVHAYNYGVLALSDLVFRTWRNPRTFPEGAFGFWDGASSKIGRMLMGRDVTT
ncbi:MAG TPA: sterol desaturase family protein [Polyangiaceae bacterium]|nr:sterol desaturase family protein [Polyangiaceae bacterium]